MNDIIRNSKPITWQEIEPLILDAKYKEFFRNLDPKTFELVLDEKNHSKVLESVLKVLKVTDPENANREFASQIIEMMRKIAGQLTKGDTYRSYLMGAVADIGAMMAREETAAIILLDIADHASPKIRATSIFTPPKKNKNPV